MNPGDHPASDVGRSTVGGGRNASHRRFDVRCGLREVRSPSGGSGRAFLRRTLSLLPPLLLFLGLLAPADARARVVINEIFYHAPADIEDLEYLELHNSGDQAVDLGGWSFTKGIQFQFPAGTQIQGNGYLVLCRNKDRFKQYYDAPVAGVFEQHLKHKGERLELTDAAGKVADAVKFSDRAPWPMGPDGYSGSLERISPEAEGNDPANWISSPLTPDRQRPGGTPGRANAGYSPVLPPVVADVQFTPDQPAPGQSVRVEAVVRPASQAGDVQLLFRTAGPGVESPETTLAMTRGAGDRYSATIPGQAADSLIRFRIRAAGKAGAPRLLPAETEPRPAFSAWVHGAIAPARIPFGWIIEPNRQNPNRPQRRPGPPWAGGFGRPPGGGGDSADSAPGRAAFAYFDPATGRAELFDFVGIVPRGGGYKVHFLKDKLLNRMSTINVIFEGNDRFVLAEPLAYEVYRRAGMAAEQSYHLRLWINGRPAGYHLLVEQPNRAFLRRNGLQDDGNLYKILWYERGVVGQHEKKTHTRLGHDDVVALVKALEKSRDAEQWDLIRKQFDVEQVINYFAVNMVLSHWDGFFNNYFTYHDTQGTGKWTLYPWDQDKTWGYHDGIGPGQVFFDMPLTFGMEGDSPPGQGRGLRLGGFSFGFGGGTMWWRPGGYFSRPLLANPQFRKLFLARTREILETIYTEEIFVPIINAMGERLRDEVRIRAEVYNQSPDQAASLLNTNLQDLRSHVKKRREFLLAQDEIKKAGKFDRADLGAGPDRPPATP